MGDLIFRKSVLLGALALGVSLSPLNAQSVDEVIVTGSYIYQSAEDAPVPVDVINSEELFNIGNPSVVEQPRLFHAMLELKKPMTCTTTCHWRM
jgi:outer membrane cobalamin receptor